MVVGVAPKKKTWRLRYSNSANLWQFQGSRGMLEYTNLPTGEHSADWVCWGWNTQGTCRPYQRTMPSLQGFPSDFTRRTPCRSPSKIPNRQDLILCSLLPPSLLLYIYNRHRQTGKTICSTVLSLAIRACRATLQLKDVPKIQKD